MLKDEIVKKLLAYLYKVITLDDLSGWLEEYDWSGSGEPFERLVMGTLEMYVTEIREEMRSEEELKRAVAALCEALSAAEAISEAFVMLAPGVVTIARVQDSSTTETAVEPLPTG